LVTISIIAYKAELAYITVLETTDLSMNVAEQGLMGRRSSGQGCPFERRLEWRKGG